MLVCIWSPSTSITSAEATGPGDTMLLVDVDVLGMTLGALIVDLVTQKGSFLADALLEYMLLHLFVAGESALPQYF